MSLAQTSRALVKNAKARFVGAADADIHAYVLLQVSVALDHPSRGIKDDDLIPHIEAAFEEAVAKGETWAVSLKNSYRDNVIKPLVDKARNKGVDPVPVIVMETDFTHEQAADMVATLDAADADTGSGDSEFDPDALGSDADADSALTSAA